MLKFSKSRWLGNKWASIEVDPVDEAYFLPVLYYLMKKYSFSHSKIIDSIDGYITDFKIGDCDVYMGIDTWSFSLAFEQEGIRDKVFDDLCNLPNDYF